MKKLTLVALFLIFGSVTVSAQVLWKHAKGGPRNGSTNSLTIDSSQNVYVCTGGDGVLRSTDHGASWHGYNKGIRQLPMKWLVSSSISGGAYVFGLSHKKELMRRVFNTQSSDNQWEYLDSIINGSSTLDITQMLTNLKGYLYLATASFGILRSRDNGLHFDQPANLKAPTPDSFVVCMTVDQRNGDLYAISEGNTFRQPEPAKWIVHLSRSTDDGKTWSLLPSVPTNPLFISTIVKADDGSIIVGYRVNSYDSIRASRSTDMGQSWKPVFWLPIEHNKGVDALIHAVKGKDLYLNAHGPTYRSTDYGATWNVRNPNKAGEETFTLVADSSERLFQCAIPDGVYSSLDSGLTFTNDSTLLVQHLDGGMAVDSKGDVLTMSQFNLYYTVDQGNYWRSPGELDEAQFPLIVCDKEDYFYYSSFDGLFRWPPNRDTFQNVIKKDLAQHPTNQVTYMAVSPTDELWASIQHDPKGDGSEPWFARSKDHGTTWTRVNTSPDYGIPTYLEVDVFGFSAGTNPNVDDTIYVSGNTNTIYRSINSGINWDIINTEGNGIIQFIGHPDGSVFRLQGGAPGKVGQPGDSGVLSGGLYRSLNGGKDWTKVFPTLAQNFADSINYFGLAVMPLLLDRSGKILICTVDSGIYRSKNKDFTEWENVSSGFDGDDFYDTKPLNCSQIVQDKKSGLYYANSRGASVFIGTSDLTTLWDAVPRSPLSPSISEPINYPNPFSKSTQISFDVPHSGFVKISIYDVMGRLIHAVQNGSLEAGKYTVPFEAAKALSSGKYMIVLQSGSDEVSHWMTVTK